jgi:hypothetical protein
MIDIVDQSRRPLGSFACVVPQSFARFLVFDMERTAEGVSKIFDMYVERCAPVLHRMDRTDDTALRLGGRPASDRSILSP